EPADRIWRETYSIAGTAGETYHARRGIELTSVPDYGGLRWHPACPWGGGGTRACVVARVTGTVTRGPPGSPRRPVNGDMARTLGAMRGCVIRLWPDELVTTGLVIGEGVELCSRRRRASAIAARSCSPRGPAAVPPTWPTSRCSRTLRR